MGFEPTQPKGNGFTDRPIPHLRRPTAWVDVTVGPKTCKECCVFNFITCASDLSIYIGRSDAPIYLKKSIDGTVHTRACIDFCRIETHYIAYFPTSQHVHIPDQFD